MAINPVQINTLSDAMVSARAKDAAIKGQDIDNLSKQMLYSTQALAGAAASGDQGQWENTLMKLHNSGVDVSMFSPDIRQGSGQVSAIRQAMYNANPMNALMNMGLRAEGNTISATNTMGNEKDAAGLAPMSAAISKAVKGGSFMPPNLSVPAGMSYPGAPENSMQKQADTSAPAMNENGRIDDMAVADLLKQMGAMGDQPASKNPPPLPQSVQAFAPPMREAGETQAAYNQRVEHALQAYKEDPQTISAQEKSKTAGKISAEDEKAAMQAAELTSRLQQNLEAMLKLNKDVPSSGFLPQEVNAYKSQIQGQHPIINAITGGDKGAGAVASHQWDQMNNQQILSDLQQFAASGGANTRLNQSIDKIIAAAAGIDKSATAQAREAQIKNALAEIANRNISQQNVVARQNGGQVVPYQEIPVTVPSEAAKAVDVNQAYKNLKSRGYSEEEIFDYLKATGQVK